MAGASSLRSQPVKGVLDRLHAEARGDRWRFVQMVPRLLAGLLARRDFWSEVPYAHTRPTECSRRPGIRGGLKRSGAYPR